MNICQICSSQTKNPKFCSAKCQFTKTICKIMYCENCKKVFCIDDRTRGRRARFCSKNCSYSWAMGKQSKKRSTDCPNCGSKVAKQKYCNKNCEMEFKIKYNYQNHIANWLNPNHEENGLKSNGVVTMYVKQWLRNRAGDQCELCGWNEIHPTLGTRPLIADHKDGDYLNNTPGNLQLICRNCDSLQSTFKGLNRGRGRFTRIQNGNKLLDESQKLVLE